MARVTMTVMIRVLTKEMVLREGSRELILHYVVQGDRKVLALKDYS